MKAVFALRRSPFLWLNFIEPRGIKVHPREAGATMYARHVWWMCRRGQAKPKFELVILTTLALAFWDKFWSSNRSPSRLLVDMSVYQDQAPQSRHLAILLYGHLQGGWGGWPTGNRKKLSCSQA